MYIELRRKWQESSTGDDSLRSLPILSLPLGDLRSPRLAGLLRLMKEIVGPSVPT
jgi:hypothetical protein